MFNNVRKNIKKIAVYAAIVAQIASVGVVMPTMSASATPITRQMENLDRGVVAVKTDDGVFVSWRRLGTEPADTQFSLYRDNTLVTSGAITNFVDPDGTKDSKYMVVTNNATQSKQVSVWEQQYIDIPLAEAPVSNELDLYTLSYANYTPGDSTVGDLDGDGEYEIVMLWNPGNAKDAASAGFTDKAYIDAYKLDGTLMWRIDMGVNIRAGAHDTQLLVADFNSDGKAELIVRTADGTVAGDGTVIGDPEKNWAELNSGKNLQGPLYLTAFEGATGKVIDTVDYDPQSSDGTSDFTEWGDSYGNRSERYLGTIAYIDGVKPSAIVQRGYYPAKDVGTGRTVVAAYSLENNKLVKKWRYDTRDDAAGIGQGNHSMAAGDVDGDGYDEVISGAIAFDHDGKVLWNTGYGHGDAHHLGDFDPTHEGLEYMKVYESTAQVPFKGGQEVHTITLSDGTTVTGAQIWGQTIQDAATGEILGSCDGVKDTGRGMIGNIGYKDSYYVRWGAGSSGYWTDKNEQLPDLALSMAGRLYWDGDLQDELQSHVTISKWNDAAGKSEDILVADGNSINSTKGNVNFIADILGDWREEFACYTVLSTEETTENVFIESANKEYPVKRVKSQYALRVYTTVIPTDYNFYTFMHDDIYRIGVATYNVCYNQPAHLGFYLSDNPNLDKVYDEQPDANIKLVANNYTEATFDASAVTNNGASAPVGGKFTDTVGHWAADTINAMVDAGIVNGMTETTFEPDASITRAQFTKLVVAAMGLDTSAAYTGACTDVANGWYAPYVQAAETAGLIDANMVAGGTFLPDQPINREEMASLVVNAAKAKSLDATGGETAQFTDKANISAWADAYVAGAVKLGIVNGMDDGSFAPKADATRAQGATMISRLLAKIK